MAHREFKDRVYPEFARVSQALASERRLELVDLLAQAPRRVEALAEEAGMSVAPLSDEIVDVIAYLQQRQDNCDVMAKNSPEWAEGARDRKRQLGVVIDDLRAGLHHGAAEVRARLQAGAGE